MSLTTTSGAPFSLHHATASLPLATEATTEKSLSFSSMDAMPSRTSGWSSTIMIVIIGVSLPLPSFLDRVRSPR